jgi:hypothetical protein
MRGKTYALATEEDLLIDLTFHKVSTSLVAEFKEKIVDPYYNGNLKTAIQTSSTKLNENLFFNLGYFDFSAFYG